jgi:hypothetical protein
MVARALPKFGRLLAVIALLAATPGLARAGPALYTGTVQIRLWGTGIPYGAQLDSPALANSPSGDTVNLSGTGPASFSLPSKQLVLTTSLFETSPAPASLDFRSTRFTAANDAGSFFGGGAPNATSFAPISSIPASELGAYFPKEQDRFGGVMKLLGHFDWRAELGASCGSCPFRTVIPLTPIGGPFGGTATAMSYAGGTAAPPTFVTATVWGFPWDTGTVSAVASVAGTSSATSTYATGADLRTPSGLGTLQLVTPFLVRVKSHPPDCGGCENRWYYAGSAKLELRFVPEPATTALLAAGLAMLAGLSRWSEKRRR